MQMEKRSNQSAISSNIWSREDAAWALVWMLACRSCFLAGGTSGKEAELSRCHIHQWKSSHYESDFGMWSLEANSHPNQERGMQKQESVKGSWIPITLLMELAKNTECRVPLDWDSWWWERRREKELRDTITLCLQSFCFQSPESKPLLKYFCLLYSEVLGKDVCLDSLALGLVILFSLLWSSRKTSCSLSSWNSENRHLTLVRASDTKRTLQACG